MRYLIVARPRHFIPHDQLLTIIHGFTSWHHHYQPLLESTAFFAGGTGGYAVVDVPDVATLNEMSLEWPLTAYCDMEVHPLLDIETGLKQWETIIQALPHGAAGR